MIYNINIIILALFLSPYCATAGETKTTTTALAKQPTEEQKKQWAADAEKYERIVHALGGKMLEHGDKNIVTDKLLTKTDIRARL